MSGRSTTGQWVVVSGGRMIGPFDGRAPAARFVADARRAGYTVARPQRLWSEHQARAALAPAPPTVDRFTPGPIITAAPDWAAS